MKRLLGGERGGIVSRQTVYVEQPGGIMCSHDGIMSSILIIAAGLALDGQLMSCDCLEKWPGFKNVDCCCCCLVEALLCFN